MVTGILKPDIDRGTFLAYVLWFTAMNQFVAYGIAMGNWELTHNAWLAMRMWLTVSWTWIGGSLDFIYWMIQGRIPSWNTELWWMPFKPKLWQWGIYALIWLVILGIIWNV
jgi:hypothetical protein